MNIQHVRAIARKEVWHLLRDPRSLALILPFFRSLQMTSTLIPLCWPTLSQLILLLLANPRQPSPLPPILTRHRWSLRPPLIPPRVVATTTLATHFNGS